jgi:hypothetical protein
MTTHAQSLLAHLRRLAAPAAPDALLLKRWIEQRDDGAFSALMARHGSMVFGICRRLLGDVQEAEDVFQATFLVLARKAETLRQPDALAAFLHTVALRLARKARSRRLDLPVGAAALLAPAAVPEKLLAASVRQLTGSVSTAVSALAAGSLLTTKKIVLVVIALLSAAGFSLLAVPARRQPVRWRFRPTARWWPDRRAKPRRRLSVWTRGAIQCRRYSPRLAGESQNSSIVTGDALL